MTLNINRKKLVWGSICTILLLLIIAFAVNHWLAQQNSNIFAIKKLPHGIDDSALLKVTGHIKDSPRPPETFGFPIPIGGVGPKQSLYSGPNQYPFYCMTSESNLGQPLVDNQDGEGVPVYAEEADGSINNSIIIGYSKDCLLETRLDYFYFDQHGEYHPYDATTKASDIKILTINNTEVPFIVKVERGVINRFIYGIAMLAGDKKYHQTNTRQYWNSKLIFQFGGGSGIGFRQGKLNLSKLIKRRNEELAKGYAVIASTGNITSYTYNTLLGEDTAMRLKRQFIGRYSAPLYTVGVGGSGGAISQYLIAQNHPDLLDGIIPQYSYPDMLSQTIYALDCDLLEHYFAITDSANDRWQNWLQRQPIVGLNHSNDVEQKYGQLQTINQLIEGIWPTSTQSNSECINGWFGLSVLINNPRVEYLRGYVDQPLKNQIHWTYWQDMVNIFGRDEQGYARTTWDNEGVQYGLNAFIDQQITTKEFIDLNRRIGSWVPQQQMQQERFFKIAGQKLPIWLSLWSRNNITPISNNVAARHQGSLEAIEQAYRYGQIFIGELNIPVIDFRHYLEDKLDMHHVIGSFSARTRLASKHRANQQLIWISHKDFDMTPQAFELIDRWLTNIRQHPDKSVHDNKPQDALDRCADPQGNTIAEGSDVWHGPWNQQSPGLCTQKYPHYSNSRIQAGDDYSTSIFKCHRISIQQAKAKGIYADRDISAIEAQLTEIFPDGVCDHSAGDMGRPADF